MLAFFANAALYVLPILVVLTLIVTIHELGHFLTARAFGVAVDRFSVGFGRAIVSVRDKWGVEWRIGWLPLGGYVRFAGDENAASVPDEADLDDLRRSIVEREGAGAEARYFPFKPLWQRALVVVAGPAANFVLAIALFALLFGTLGEVVTQGPIAQVMPGSAAAAAGFLAGDEVVGADGQTIRGFEDLREYVAYRDGVAIDFAVMRGGKLIHLDATPQKVVSDSPFGGQASGGQLGVSLAPQQPKIVHYDPISAIGMGVSRTWDAVATTGFYFGRLITGHVGVDQLHGVIGTARASGAIAKQAIDDAPGHPALQAMGVIVNMVGFCALLSIWIGLVNLMPIPVLDGGHLLFYAYEGIVRRPLSAGVQAAGYRVGLALLACLLLVANGNDLHLQKVFHFIGGLFS
ncbi:MAG TPA: M50 family metallopeptidase [Caulobacteraceae bacterium]|jgi:regulator of sigma E protease